MRKFFPNMSIRNAITKLGGIPAVARGLGHRNVTTVQGWWDRDTIPARRQPEVLGLAVALGLPLDPVEIIPGQDWQAELK